MTGCINFIRCEVYQEQEISLFQMTTSAPGVVTGQWYESRVDTWSMGKFNNQIEALEAAKNYCDRVAKINAQIEGDRFTVCLNFLEVAEVLFVCNRHQAWLTSGWLKSQIQSLEQSLENLINSQLICQEITQLLQAHPNLSQCNFNPDELTHYQWYSVDFNTGEFRELPHRRISFDRSQQQLILNTYCQQVKEIVNRKANQLFSISLPYLQVRRLRIICNCLDNIRQRLDELIQPFEVGLEEANELE